MTQQAPPYLVSIKITGVTPAQKQTVESGLGSNPLLWQAETQADGSFWVTTHVDEGADPAAVAVDKVRAKLQGLIGPSFDLGDIRVEPWRPYNANPSDLTEGQLNLLETLYDVLRTYDRWPPFRYLEDYLYRKFKINIEDIAESLPTGLTNLPPPGYPASDQQEINLTIEGMRYVELPGASDDVDLFFRVFRRFVVEDERLVASIEAQPNPCLLVSDLSQEWEIHPTPMRRVLRIAAFEPWSSGWSTVGVENSDFRLCANPRTLRRFARAQTMNEYLALRREVYPLGPPPESPFKAMQHAAERIAATSQRLGIASGSAQRHEASGASRPIQPRDAKEWDVFICHAYPDKEPFVRGLAEALQNAGVKVWYDDFTLKVGDSLREKIDEGLVASRYGAVVFSPDFFERQWTRTELDGLAQKQNTEGRKVILPVLHDVTIEQLRDQSPTLAGLYAVSSDRGVTYVTKELLKAMDFPPPLQVEVHISPDAT